MGYFNRVSQYNLDARKHPVYKSWWKPPEATARSTARRAASAAYTSSGTAQIKIDVDARGTLSMLDRLKMSYLGKAGVRRIVREEIVKARKSVQNEAKTAMKSDPRKAYKGVQMLVYKGGGKTNEGGNINILAPRKKEMTRMVLWSMTRKRGKIRRKRKISPSTRQIDGYTGASRYFVLHWIDAGTPNRPKRGKIGATNFFTKSARQALTLAASNVKRKVGELVKKG